jgi:hypothetical protein
MLGFAAVAFEVLLAGLYMLPSGRGARAAARLAIVFHVLTLALTRGKVAWIFLQHALVQGAFFLPAPRPLGRRMGWIFWLAAGVAVTAVQRLCRKRYVRALHATPVLDREDRAIALHQQTLLAGKSATGLAERGRIG